MSKINKRVALIHPAPAGGNGRRTNNTTNSQIRVREAKGIGSDRWRMPERADRSKTVLRKTEKVGPLLFDATSDSRRFQLLDSYPINPGISKTHPWGSGVADGFETYHCHRFAVKFVPNLGNIVGGTVTLSFSENTLMPNPISSQAQFQHAVKTVFDLSDSESNYCRLDLGPNDVDPHEEHFVRTDGIAGVDLKTYDCGRIFVSIEGLNRQSLDVNPVADLNIGFLVFEYHYTLMGQRPFSNISSESVPIGSTSVGVHLFSTPADKFTSGLSSEWAFKPFLTFNSSNGSIPLAQNECGIIVTPGNAGVDVRGEAVALEFTSPGRYKISLLDQIQDDSGTQAGKDYGISAYLSQTPTEDPGLSVFVDDSFVSQFGSNSRTGGVHAATIGEQVVDVLNGNVIRFVMDALTTETVGSTTLTAKNLSNLGISMIVEKIGEFGVNFLKESLISGFQSADLIPDYDAQAEARKAIYMKDQATLFRNAVHHRYYLDRDLNKKSFHPNNTLCHHARLLAPSFLSISPAKLGFCSSLKEPCKLCHRSLSPAPSYSAEDSSIPAGLSRPAAHGDDYTIVN